MRCGHGWEQDYEIRHHVDAQGRAYVTYHADGRRVPSPLTRPTCLNCGGNVVRIMRSGQIPASAAGLAQQGIAGPLLALGAPMEPPVTARAEDQPSAGGPTAGEGGAARSGAPDRGEQPTEHRRRLSGLLHGFHRK
jgi:hypothetical protein